MQLNSNLSATVTQRWQILKNGINQNLDSFTQSIQQQATKTTDNTKDYLENNWHNVEKITNNTSGVIQKTINTSVHDFSLIRMHIHILYLQMICIYLYFYNIV